jgi:hypothetical protein
MKKFSLMASSPSALNLGRFLNSILTESLLKYTIKYLSESSGITGLFSSLLQPTINKSKKNIANSLKGEKK